MFSILGYFLVFYLPNSTKKNKRKEKKSGDIIILQENNPEEISAW